MQEKELRIADLYIRVSTQEQANTGYSVGEQEEALKAYCKAYNYKINAVRKDPGYSGSSLERPGIQEVIQDVESGDCNLVIVWKLDRLSRSQKDTLMLLEDIFIKNECGFISLNESFDTSTPIGRCMVGILSAFAQMERENIRMRVMMGKEASVKAGVFQGSHAPLGYKFICGEKCHLQVDDYAAQAVKDIFKMRMGGESLMRIGRYIQKEYGFFKNSCDATLCKGISQIIRNKTYIGIIEDKTGYYKALHEPIIDMQTWETVKAICDEETKTYTKRRTRTTSLVGGIIYCGYCGARMARRNWSGNTTFKWACYSVVKTSPAMIKDLSCPNRSYYHFVSDIDNYIENQLKELYMNPKTSDKPIVDNEKKEKQKAFEKKAKEIEGKIEKLLELYESGAIEMSYIKPRLDKLKEERAALRDNIINFEDIKKLPKEQAEEIIDTIPDTLEHGDIENKAALVHALVRRVEIKNVEISIEWAF